MGVIFTVRLKKGVLVSVGVAETGSKLFLARYLVSTIFATHKSGSPADTQKT